MPFSVTSPSFTFLKVTEDKSTAVLEIVRFHCTRRQDKFPGWPCSSSVKESWHLDCLGSLPEAGLTKCHKAT
ncbi:hypothetical protein L345_04294, partial [Ophiophagus hannah]